MEKFITHLQNLENTSLELRYGENPHESALLFGEPAFEILHEGKQISYNNILDAEASWVVAKNLYGVGNSAVVVKHQTPCGVAYQRDNEPLTDVVQKAIKADEESSYGGILATNFEIDEKIAEAIKTYLEVIIAPSFTQEGINILSKRKVRLLKVKDYKEYTGKVVFNSLIISERKFPQGEFEFLFGEEYNIKDIIFAYKICEGVKSNAIVIVKNGVTVGIGGGQPSRKRSAWIATQLAGENCKGALAASDAFFPFPDSLEILAQAGVKCVVAPLGSIRDDEVLKKAQELGLTFHKAPNRVFRH